MSLDVIVFSTNYFLIFSCRHDNLLLLDCGEGTLGQLQRLLGPQTDQALCSLRAIFISHLHADHHIGLVGILQARQRSLERARPGQEHPPLLLLAPKQIMYWLEVSEKETVQFVDKNEINQCLKFITVLNKSDLIVIRDSVCI